MCKLLLIAYVVIVLWLKSGSSFISKKWHQILPTKFWEQNDGMNFELKKQKKFF